MFNTLKSKREKTANDKESEKGINEKKTGSSVVLNSIITKTIPYKRKISLILFIKTAFKADLLAVTLVNQKLINK